VWRRPKGEVVALLRDDPLVGLPLTRWVQAVTRHYAGGEAVDTALDAIRAGVAFLDAVAEWARHRLA